MICFVDSLVLEPFWNKELIKLPVRARSLFLILLSVVQNNPGFEFEFTMEQFTVLMQIEYSYQFYMDFEKACEVIDKFYLFDEIKVFSYVKLSKETIHFLYNRDFENYLKGKNLIFLRQKVNQIPS